MHRRGRLGLRRPPSVTRSGPHTIAVVIPALEESVTICAAVRSSADADDVLVVDGGSRDGTAGLARDAGARVASAPRGRASQMNAGVRETSAEWLLFLHADTVLPSGWREHVESLLSDTRVSCGAFRFGVGGTRVRDRIICAVGGARAALTCTPYGDQALFMRRSDFERVGGFPDQPIMEDWELVRRLRRLGAVRCAPAVALTSSRQWDTGGLVRSTACYLAVIVGYRLGVRHERLVTMRENGLGRSYAPGS